MWHSFGVHADATSVCCKASHPADPSRFIHFISDFPHLMKCVRNLMLKAGFNTPEGRVSTTICFSPHFAPVNWKCIADVLMWCFYLLSKTSIFLILKAHWEHISATWKCESSDVTPKAAHRLTRAHIYPNGFEKMRVDLAFQVFSPSMLHAFFIHKGKVEEQYPNLEPTRAFVELMVNLIRVMTSRTPLKALR